MGVVALVLGGVGLLQAGCAADSHAPLPAFMRVKTVEPPPLEAPPDIGLLLRDHLDAVFVASSNPTQVRFAAPHHLPIGAGWVACVRAALTSATGRPIGEQSYLITIHDGVIDDRRRAETTDNCGSETYQPI